MRTFAAIALTASVSALSAAEHKFMEFIVKYNKSYGTIEEFNFRFDQFMKMESVIESHNNTPSSYVLAHNKFSDFTDFEFERML
jgi:hypothetical protein